MQYGRISRGAMAADVLGEHFTQIYNGKIRDKRLPGTAKAVFDVIASHRNGYGISAESICEYMYEGLSAVKAALRKLEEFGYLVRTRERREDGTLGATVYAITDMPDGLILHAPKPYPAENPRSEPKVEIQPLDSDEENPRSEPRVENPPVDNPPVDNRTTKKTSFKNTTSLLRSEGDTSTREKPPAAVNTDAPHQTAPDGANRTKAAVKLPEGWAPSAELVAKAALKFPGLDFDDEFIDFENYWRYEAPPSKRKRADWDRTWWNRMKDQFNRRPDLRPRPPKPPVDETPSLFEQEAAPVFTEADVQDLARRWLGQSLNGSPVLGSTVTMLRKLVRDAMTSGATSEKVWECLELVGEPCPTSWHFQNALAGRPIGRQGAARQSAEEIRREEDRAAMMRAAARMGAEEELFGSRVESDLSTNIRSITGGSAS